MTHIHPPIRKAAAWPSGRLAFAIAACAVLGAPAQAEKADRLKPLTIDADAGRYDDLKQVGVFTGNVVLSKGTLQMRAAQVEVRQSPDGQQTGVARGAPGALATFSQKREGLNESIEGEAERIEYDARSNTVRLVNRATIRRLRDGVVADETAGSVITYDNLAEVFTVVGGPSAATPTNPSGRVRTVITPPAAAEAAASSAEPPASTPAPPPLQPSSRLGGTRP